MSPKYFPFYFAPFIMIWLASFPRSGNTFFRNVLFDVYGISSSTYHHDPTRPRDHNFSGYPVVKTHLLPGQLPLELRDQPAVYLVRDGRDALVSIAHHRKDFVAPGTDFYNNLLEATLAQNGSFFGGWSENVQQWTSRAAIVIYFEDLIRDPIKEVEKIRTLIDLPKPDLTKVPTFESQRNGRPNYGAGRGKNFSSQRAKKHFRSGKIGSWKTDVPHELSQLLNNVHGSTLRQLGYTVENSQDPPLKKRVIIEASKLFSTDNDGIQRYLSSLRQGLLCLLPYFPHLEVLMFDEVGIIKLDRPKEQEQVDFKASSEEESILVNRRTMSYEKTLLLLKVKIKNALPQSQYRLVANFYKNGPFRKFLTFFQKKARNTVNKLGQSPLDRIINTTDLIHIPLPQHLNLFALGDKQTLVTVHDFSHKLHPEYHEELNVQSAESGMQKAVDSGAHFLSVSRSTQADLIKFHPTREKELHLVPEAADISVFNLSAKEKDPKEIHQFYNIPAGPYLMCLSTIEPRKNLANTIRAFLQLKEENPELECSLVICGKKGWKTENIFKDLPIDRPDIVFTGFVNDEDLPVLYAHARALCYVSIYEGFGLPIVEAMACGTPVIYGNNSSQPEVAGDGGIGVAADDVPGIATAMHRMLTNDEFHAEKAEAAWQQANKFSWLKTALLTLDVYEKILNDPT